MSIQVFVIKNRDGELVSDTYYSTEIEAIGQVEQVLNKEEWERKDTRTWSHRETETMVRIVGLQRFMHYPEFWKLTKK